MGMTMSEKILSMACCKTKVSPGEIVWVRVDRAMMDDILGPRVEISNNFKKLKTKIWDESKVVVISDHYTPPANAKQAEIVKYTREWAEENKINNYYEFIGPCHQIMVEKGYVLPGEIIVGTDSHTCTYGALGSFATGIGSTEMSAVLMTGQIWFKVPKTIKVEWNGKLGEYVMAKDIALKSIGEIGHSGATYMAVEFSGDTIDELIIDERLAITNMAVEMGAKTGLIAVDDKTVEYLKKTGVTKEINKINSDEDASFFRKYSFDSENLEPMVACPHEVDNVQIIKNIEKTKINQAYIGSCTGGRYNDLKVAAEILNGKKVAKGVRLLISPASKDIYNQCIKTGVMEILSDAGATILAPSCGACLGVHSGAIGEGETCFSTTNRNFVGRMGSVKSYVYLGSPASVAVSAIAGYIKDPREK